MRKYDIFEPENELNERINVLQQLNSLAKHWIYDLSLARVSFLGPFFDSSSRNLDLQSKSWDYYHGTFLHFISNFKI